MPAWQSSQLQWAGIFTFLLETQENFNFLNADAWIGGVRSGGGGAERHRRQAQRHQEEADLTGQ
jgi:hypothetical protein